MPRINQTNYRTTRNKQNEVRVSDAIQNQDTVDLVGLFFRLLENLKFMIIGAVICAMIAGVWTFYFIIPQYKATAKIYVLSPGDSVINLADIQLGTALTADYQEVFKNWIVHERVIQTLVLPYSYSELIGMLTITNPSNTRILYITVTSSNALEAKTIADTYAKIAQEFIASTFDTKEPNLFEEALLPSVPFTPSKIKNIAIGFLVGLLFSSFVITVRFIAGDRIRSSEDIERISGLPTLGAIPIQGNVSKSKQKSRNKTKCEKRKVVQ